MEVGYGHTMEECHVGIVEIGSAGSVLCLSFKSSNEETDVQKEIKGAKDRAPVSRCDTTTERVLPSYDVTALIGLRAVVRNVAIQRIDEEGEETIEVPKLRELMASVAVARCLVPLRLAPHEIKAIRKIMKMTMAEMAKRMDERTAPETVSRWEDSQPMGGYAEKVFRLLACTELSKEALGISYNGSMISDLVVLDPTRVGEEIDPPYIEMDLLKIKEPSGVVTEAWDKIAA